MSRPVVAAVCYRISEGRVEFLLVRTRGGKYWTFPKGHVEALETPWQAAQREAGEEAGVSGNIQRKPFASYRHLKTGGAQNVDAYLMAVVSESGSHEPDRQPQWFSSEMILEKLAEGRNHHSVREYERVVQQAVVALRER